VYSIDDAAMRTGRRSPGKTNHHPIHGNSAGLETTREDASPRIYITDLSAPTTSFLVRKEETNLGPCAGHVFKVEAGF